MRPFVSLSPTSTPQNGDVVLTGGATASHARSSDVWVWTCPLGSCAFVPPSQPPFCYLSGQEAMADCRLARGQAFAWTCDAAALHEKVCASYHVYNGITCSRLCDAHERV